MDLALRSPSTGPEKASGKSRRAHRATRPQLLTRDRLDGRSNAAKVFDRLVVDIEADLGGRDQLSTIERALVEGFAGAAVTLYHLNTKLALGEKIDLAQHAQAVSAMVRVASVWEYLDAPSEVGPTLTDLIRADQERQREQQQP